MNFKRIEIFSGYYGCGKTEVSINFVRKLAKENPDKKFAIIDLDIVNPYFRSREARDLLESEGIKVVSSFFKDSFMDIPALTADIKATILNDEYNVIIDVGGDDEGSTVLGRYSDSICKFDYNMNLVINLHRNFSEKIEDLKLLIRNIETVSQLEYSYLINNTHFLEHTTKEDVIDSTNKIKNIDLDYDMRFVSSLLDISDSELDNTKHFKLERILKNIWEI